MWNETVAHTHYQRGKNWITRIIRIAAQESTIVSKSFRTEKSKNISKFTYQKNEPKQLFVAQEGKSSFKISLEHVNCSLIPDVILENIQWFHY